MLKYTLLIFAAICCINGEWPSGPFTDTELTELDLKAMADVLMPNMSKKGAMKMGMVVRKAAYNNESPTCAMCKVLWNYIYFGKCGHILILSVHVYCGLLCFEKKH